MKKFLITLTLAVVSICFLNAQNNALLFDGTDDYISVPDNASLDFTKFSIEMWVYRTSSSNVKLIGQTNAGNNERGYIFGISDDGKLNLEVWDDWNTYTNLKSSETIPLNEWVHLTMTWESGVSLKGYINGKIVLNSSTISSDITNTTPIIIGMAPWYEKNENHFNGYMDEIRIWNDVRTESEIRRNMYHELPDPASETNLVSYYKFNETSGTTLTDSKGSNNGTLNNMSGSEWKTSSAFFGPKKCLDFDGTNDYVSCGNDASLSVFNQMTMEAWVNLANSQNDQKILGKCISDLDHDFFVMGVNEGKLNSEIKINGNNISTMSGNVPSGKWTHLAVTFSKGNGGDNGTICAYVNGTLVYSNTAVPDASINVSSDSYPFIIGAPSWNYSEKNVDGLIDEVRIWNTARTNAQIREDMCKTLNGNETGLVAYYRFDQTDGTTLYDLTANGNNGTLTNMEDADWVSSNAFTTWQNTTDTDWSTATNWSGGNVPDESDHVGIYSDLSAPVINSTGSCDNLYVASGTSMTVGTSGALTVGGMVTNNGTLTIASGSTGTGSLISGDMTSGTGSAVVESYMTKDAWHIISSPAPDQTIGSFLSSNSTIMDNPSDATQKAFKDYDESTNTWNSLTAYSTSSTDLMGAGKGYSVWPDVTGVVSFTGIPLSGSQSKSLVRTGDNGWNCIGNPYTSSIAINSTASASNNFIDLNSSNIDDNYAAIYVWEQSSYQYTIINHSSGAFYAPVGQGFFVKAAATGTIGFASTMQSHQTGVSLRSATVVPQISIRALLNGKRSTTTVKFLENTTSGLDVGYDAGVMKTGFDVYTRLVKDNGVDFGIQCLPVEADVSYVIPVGLETTAGGTVELQLNALNMPADYIVTFEDALNGTSTEVGDNGKVLTVDMSAGNNLDRFSLKVGTTVTGLKNVSENPTIVTKFDEICIYGAKAGKATLYDLQGRCVRRMNLTGATVTRIPTSGLAEGVYLLKLDQQGSTGTRKIVLNN